jgi:hypothetical protein
MRNHLSVVALLLLACCGVAHSKSLVLSTQDETYYPISAGGTLTIAWTSTSTSLPLTATIRDFATGTQILFSYSPSLRASDSIVLGMPYGLLPGPYTVWLCDRANFCGASDNFLYFVCAKRHYLLKFTPRNPPLTFPPPHTRPSLSDLRVVSAGLWLHGSER